MRMDCISWRKCLASLAAILVGVGLNSSIVRAQSTKESLPAPFPKVTEAPVSELPVGVGPVTGSSEAKAGDGDCASGACAGFDWTKSKYRYQKFFWPIGYPPIPPTTPGYYSLTDFLTGNYRDKPPKNGYTRFFANPQGFGDVDFSYVDAKGYEPTILERMHRIHIGDNWMIGTGGEYRLRYNWEENARLTGRENEYGLSRLRVFGDLWYKDVFRVYCEFLDAQTMNQSLPPTLGDRDYAEILNLFADVKMFSLADENVYARIGRQQVLLGSQRIISPSDWANTLRSMDGVRLFRRSEKFDIDAFWYHPVIPNRSALNSQDDQVNFAGIYTTYRPAKDQILDTYYLFLGDNNSPARARTQAVGPLSNTPYDTHTLGFRYAGRKNWFLWDSENMLQLGQQQGHDLFAGNASNGLGVYLADCPMTPTFWAYFDYATGSNSVAGSNTYNQLYPLAHYYLGWMDYVGRANIQDINFHAYFYPTHWITCNVQYHILHLARAKDALYNVAAQVSRVDPTGRAGRDVGQELDFIVNWHIAKNVDIVTAYSHFFAGDFLQATGPTNNMNTAWLIYNIRW